MQSLTAKNVSLKPYQISKLMKKIISAVGLFCILLLSACKEQTSYPVGKQDGATFTLNSDISKAKKYFEFVLAHSNLDNDISIYRILQQKDLQTNAGYYVLVGSTTDNHKHIAIELFEDEAQLGITSESLTKNVVICSSDCENGCTPQKSNGAWICSDDCKAECIKTETKAYEENNYTTPIQAFLEKY